MWLVVMAFSFILRFVKGNEAATFKVKYNYYLYPLNLLYFMMLLLGMNKDFGAFCRESTYPYIFTFQYGIFFFTYLVYLFLYHKNFYIEWDSKAIEPGAIEAHELTSTTMIDKDVRRKTEARLVFM